MIRYKNYSNVIDSIKCIGDSLHNIKTVTTGDLFEVDLEKNTLYPLLHLITEDVTVAMSTQTFNIRIFVMDLVEPDLSNEQDVQSDTYQTIVDIIGLLKHGEILYGYNTVAGEEQRYFIDDSFTVEPFTERFSSNVTGWTCSMPIIVESVLDTCDIPHDVEAICTK